MRENINWFKLPRRVWINQPSTLQEFHYLHGKRGVAIQEDYQVKNKLVRVYFTEGDLRSIILPISILDILL